MSQKKSMLGRRQFLAMSSAVVAGGVLAACAPKVEPTAAPAATKAVEEPVATAVPAEKPGVTVEYWFGWGANYNEDVWNLLRETDEFKEAIGNNTVETKGSMGGEPLLTAVAGGTPPDGASNTQYLDYMARGVLRPIDDWVATSDIIKQSNYLEGSWNDAFYQGTMYGVPANEGFLRYGLNYNSRMVEEAGLDPNSPPKTWADCLEWHKKLTTFDDAGNLIQIGFDPYDAMGGSVEIQNGFYATVSWGWNWFDVATGEFDVGNDMMAQSFEIEAEFVKFVGPDNLAGLRSVEGQGGWGGSYNTEVQAMLIEGYWHPGETKIQKPEVAEFNMATWAPVPEDRRNVNPQGTGGHYVIMFNESQHPEEMFSVGEFLNTNIACDIIFKNVGWLPGLIPFIEQADPSIFPGLDFYFDSVNEATEWSSPARCPITQYVGTQYTELREAVYRDEMTGKEAATEFQSRCESEYKAQGF